MSLGNPTQVIASCIQVQDQQCCRQEKTCPDPYLIRSNKDGDTAGGCQRRKNYLKELDSSKSRKQDVSALLVCFVGIYNASK